MIKRGKAPLYAEHGMPILNQKCIRINRVDLAPVRYTDAVNRPVPDYALVQAGDVLVTSTGRGTAGRAALAPDLGQPFTVDSHVSIVRPSLDRVLPEYLAWVFSWRQADLESLQSGSTTQTELSPVAIGSLIIPIPPLVEQFRIVDLLAAVDAQINALEEELSRCECTYRNALSLLWLNADGAQAAERPLASIMRLDIERVILDDATTYRLAGVLNEGQGLTDKGPFLGSETKYGAMNMLRDGQVVMRKLTAWEGPISVVPPEYDCYVASNEFPTFSLDDDVSRGWMRHVCRSTRLWSEMRNRVTGTVQRRKRLSPEQLLSVSLPIPPLDQQVRIQSALDALESESNAVRDELVRLRAFQNILLASLLGQEIEIPESYDDLLEAVS